MKTTVLLLVVVLLEFAIVHSLHSQWVRNGLQGTAVSGIVIVSNISGGTYIFAGTNGNGIYRCAVNDTTWTPVNSGLTVSLTNFGTFETTLTGTQTNLFAGCSRGVYRSTDNGTSWVLVNSGLPWSVTSLAAIPNGIGGTALFAGTFFGGVYRSTNDGTNWSQVNSGLGSMNIYSLGVANTPGSGATLFAGTDVGVYRSTDNGGTWTSSNSGLSGVYVKCFTTLGTDIVAGTSSTNGPFRGIFVSTNNGTTWDTTGLSNGEINGLTTIGNTLFGSVYFPGLVLSTDTGASWRAVNTAGLTANYGTYSIGIPVLSGTDLYAGTWDGVWRRPLSEIITSVRNRGSDGPNSFALFQNYHNPFNPTTTIRYQIPEASFVTLKVHDMLGREMTTLVSERQNAGYHTVTFDAGNLPSGVYFYRISANRFSAVKKLLLIR